MDDRAGAFYAMEDFGIIDFLSAQKCSFRFSTSLRYAMKPQPRNHVFYGGKVEGNKQCCTPYGILQEIEGGYP